MDNTKILGILYETIYAEHGSALEMLAACKQAKSSSLAFGYFEHSKDEYNHTKTFRKILSNKTSGINTSELRRFRITPQGLIRKGYVSQNGYLVENMSLKNFIAYVYTNELLAESSFSKIVKLLGANTEEGRSVMKIMEDELRHHGKAKEYFLRYFPFLQPWQLSLYKLRESIKNKGRKFYHSNIALLEHIFYPLYSLFALIISRLLKSLNLKEFKRSNKNLMDINYKSIL